MNNTENIFLSIIQTFPIGDTEWWSLRFSKLELSIVGIGNTLGGMRVLFSAHKGCGGGQGGFENLQEHDC